MQERMRIYIEDERAKAVEAARTEATEEAIGRVRQKLREQIEAERAKQRAEEGTMCHLVSPSADALKCVYLSTDAAEAAAAEAAAAAAADGEGDGEKGELRPRCSTFLTAIPFL